MNKRAAIAFLAISMLAGGAAGAANAPVVRANNGIPNLHAVEQEILSYYQSGRYAHDAATVDGSLESYVDGRVRSGARKPAVVFDIDDTAVSAFAYERSHQFSYDPASWTRWEHEDRFPAIAPTLRLAKHLAAEHVAIFFITGRREPDLAATQRELAEVGYPKPTGLFLRPATDHASSVIPFKSQTRRRIEAMGYTVLASAGDQLSDLRGGYAERLYKLPNPMYFIP